MGNGIENNNKADKPVSVFRTRKSEIISGISVVTLIALFSFARSVVHDFNETLENQARAFDKRIERVENQLTSSIKLERERHTDDVKELKQRIIWIERELLQDRKIAP